MSRRPPVGEGAAASRLYFRQRGSSACWHLDLSSRIHEVPGPRRATSGRINIRSKPIAPKRWSLDRPTTLHKDRCWAWRAQAPRRRAALERGGRRRFTSPACWVRARFVVCVIAPEFAAVARLPLDVRSCESGGAALSPPALFGSAARALSRSGSCRSSVTRDAARRSNATSTTRVGVSVASLAAPCPIWTERAPAGLSTAAAARPALIRRSRARRALFRWSRQSPAPRPASSRWS